MAFEFIDFVGIKNNGFNATIIARWLWLLQGMGRMGD
jgi:hypothetical protein